MHIPADVQQLLTVHIGDGSEAKDKNVDTSIAGKLVSLRVACGVGGNVRNSNNAKVISGIQLSCAGFCGSSQELIEMRCITLFIA